MSFYMQALTITVNLDLVCANSNTSTNDKGKFRCGLW